LALKCAIKNVGENIMMRKAGLLVAAIMLAAFAAPSDSFAAKKKTDEGSSFKDVSQCTGGACTAVNPDRVPSPQHQYRSSKKKHK
jgi:hypothetical protein